MYDLEIFFLTVNAFRRVCSGRAQSTATDKAWHESLWVCWLGLLHVHDRSRVSVSPFNGADAGDWMRDGAVAALRSCCNCKKWRRSCCVPSWKPCTKALLAPLKAFQKEGSCLWADVLDLPLEKFDPHCEVGMHNAWKSQGLGLRRTSKVLRVLGNVAEK